MVKINVITQHFDERQIEFFFGENWRCDSIVSALVLSYVPTGKVLGDKTFLVFFLPLPTKSCLSTSGIYFLFTQLLSQYKLFLHMGKRIALGSGCYFT